AAGENEPGAHLDVLLHGRVVVDAAHTRVLAVSLAGGDDRLVGVHDPRVVVLAGNADVQREGVRADQQHVHPRHRRAGPARGVLALLMAWWPMSPKPRRLRHGASPRPISTVRA